MTITDRSTLIPAVVAHRYYLKASYQPNMMKAWVIVLLLLGIFVAIHHCTGNTTKHFDRCGSERVVARQYIQVRASMAGGQSLGATPGGASAGSGYRVIKSTSPLAVRSSVPIYEPIPPPVGSGFAPESEACFADYCYGDGDFGLPDGGGRTFEPHFAMPNGVEEQQITHYEPPYIKIAELRLSWTARETKSWEVEALIFFGASDGIDSILVIAEEPDTLGLGNAFKRSLEDGFCWSGRLCSADGDCTKVASVVHFIFKYREGSLTHTFGEENLTIRLPAEYYR